MKSELALYQKLEALEMRLDADIRGEELLNPTEELCIMSQIELLKWILEVEP